jgi:hypothetical protein
VVVLLRGQKHTLCSLELHPKSAIGRSTLEQPAAERHTQTHEGPPASSCYGELIRFVPTDQHDLLASFSRRNGPRAGGRRTFT